MLHFTTALKPVLTALIFLLGIMSLSAQDPDEVDIVIKPVSGSVYMLTGKGGNIGLLTGDDGILMVDAQYAPLTAKIVSAIAKISPLPIKYLVNTHWHGDHTGGNENIAKAGSIVVAQDNVRKRMSSEQTIKAFSKTVPPSPEAARPTITFSEDLTFHMNGEKVFLFHLHNAHTDGDAIVWFMDSNVVHTGDTYFRGRFPYIDLSSGGSIEGLIQGINHLLFLIDEDTRIIPGHGTLSNKKEMTEYRNMLMTVRDRVKKAIAEGKTLEEIKAANLTSEYDEAWGGGFINPERFVDIVYTSLTMDNE